MFPTLAVNETTTRLHWTLTYAPGFTFYQHTSSLNQADQNASIDLQYRLSPHVTFSARDGFQKSSSVFNQPSLGYIWSGVWRDPGAEPVGDCAVSPASSTIPGMWVLPTNSLRTG